MEKAFGRKKIKKNPSKYNEREAIRGLF